MLNWFWESCVLDVLGQRPRSSVKASRLLLGVCFVLLLGSMCCPAWTNYGEKCVAATLLLLLRPCHCGGESGHKGSSSGWQSLTVVFFHGITHAYVRAKLLWRRLGEAAMSFWIKKNTPWRSRLLLGLQHLGCLSFGSALCSQWPWSFKC